ncbi:hypothetical protein [Microcystis phage MaeS]|nr:hypothetical protein [Microcystis phage MaeS]
MHNYKLVFFCQRCKKEHDRTDEPMFETGVVCGINGCQGYVITPSGRGNMQIKQTCEVWFIQGQERAAWIASKSQKEARKFYVDTFNDTLVSVSKMKPEEMFEPRFAYDPDQTGDPDQYLWLSAQEVLTTIDHLPALVFQVSPETLKAWLELKKRGEL